MSSGLSPSSSQTERDQASKMNSTSTTASNLGGEDAADAETATESDLPVRRPSTRTKTSGGRMSTQNLAFIAADLQAMAEALALAAKEATEGPLNGLPKCERKLGQAPAGNLERQLQELLEAEEE
eukprot:TRINITY_DN24390_c0_g2_i3.p1 TRINITY_DN24390_c0_g2~~TRINITY_DN24390_c0_g2_i3.p1  ORF type:complete len:125 (-),score=31.81 TRINITY_DN24390_c0_g2_i3:517-891(-)